MAGDQFSGLGRISAELLRFEIAWKHESYTSSGIGRPCASEGEKPSIEPSVGTRSVDCMRPIENRPLANSSAQSHHPRGPRERIAGAVMLKSVAAGILVGVTPEIRQDEQRGVAGIFRLALDHLPQFPAEAVGAPDPLDIQRVSAGVGDIDIVQGDPQTGWAPPAASIGARYTSKARPDSTMSSHAP